MNIENVNSVNDIIMDTKEMQDIMDIEPMHHGGSKKRQSKRKSMKSAKKVMKSAKKVMKTPKKVMKKSMKAPKKVMKKTMKSKRKMSINSLTKFMKK